MILTLFLASFFGLTRQQIWEEEDEEEEDDDCAFISGQDCDQNGICKYCAMCLQSSCILSKTIGTGPTTCNTTQFGTTNLYNWYDYCLSSDNDVAGSYCATSTECYQYRKSAGPSVTYAWHNLTCNPSTCMLIASNGAPPPIPVPPQTNSNLPDSNLHRLNNNSHHHDDEISDNADKHHYYHDKRPLQNPAAIGLTIVCSLLIVVFLCYIAKRYKKKSDEQKEKNKQPPSAAAATAERGRTQSVTSTIPSSAPPSFSSAPPDMSVIRHPHVRWQPTSSTRSSTGSVEPLPSYLTPYSSPPKYEQAIVTQIRDLREDNASSSTRLEQQPPPTAWVPVYFTRQQNNFQSSVNRGEVFGFTPNHSYWLQHLDDP
ncbi:uncharacterized protein EV154DRAFT_573259 [Mucor mucedo]|uniref:uncharacterized protein n=1 Tax=Mucor mucedo TaxID=29922 RepID=UPI002220E69B|nr:uncharacterized protein EV154DRAFT_573259 [Mucor mucedo]KAI7897433.1 hypothetical protein EV154DRAFT_573259 [Mucor mucedo]